MVDMGQADSTLRMRPLGPAPQMCWTIAVQKAAFKMGYAHFRDVPGQRNDDLRKEAQVIQGGNV